MAAGSAHRAASGRAAGGVAVSDDSPLAGARRAAAELVDDLRTELEGIFEAQQAAPPDDEHDVEGASVGFERARVTALLAAAESRLAALDAAAARSGSGVVACESCGEPIDPERLAAMPEATRCVGCASRPTRGVRG